MATMIKKIIVNFFTRTFTEKYPKEKANVSINYRGSIHIDQKKCISCGLCERNCPTGAIVVDKEKKYSVVDRNLCILCGLCAEVCPVNVIWFSNDYEVGNKRRDELKKQLPGPNPRPKKKS